MPEAPAWPPAPGRDGRPVAWEDRWDDGARRWPSAGSSASLAATRHGGPVPVVAVSTAVQPGRASTAPASDSPPAPRAAAPRAASVSTAFARAAAPTSSVRSGSTPATPRPATVSAAATPVNARPGYRSAIPTPAAWSAPRIGTVAAAASASLAAASAAGAASTAPRVKSACRWETTAAIGVPPRRPARRPCPIASNRPAPRAAPPATVRRTRPALAGRATRSQRSPPR